MQALAALSTHLELKPEILAAGTLPVLCRLAKLRMPLLQAPTAAALANLCADAGTMPGPDDLQVYLSFMS